MNLTETMIKDFSKIVNFVNLESLVLDKNELEVRNQFFLNSFFCSNFSNHF